MRRSERWGRFIDSLNIRTNDPGTGKPVIKPLRYNTAQQDVWSKVADRIDRLQPIRLIILKSRREGISTAIESWLLTFIASMPNVNALITAHQKDAAKEIFAMSKLFVTSSPLLARVATVDRDTITIGRSRLKVATAGSPESQRGVDLTAWHSSEAAQYDHPEVMLATMQCLPQRDDVFSIGVIESTANGKTGSGEMFYDEWCRAEAGESDWLPIFLPWHEFTDYRIKGATIEQPTAEEFALRERFELTDEQLAWRRWAVRNKCIAGDARVGTNLGIVRLDDARYASVTSGGQRVLSWLSQGSRRVMRLETRLGRVLRATGDHRILHADGAWSRMDALQPGDALQLEPPQFSSQEATLRHCPGGALEMVMPVTEEVARFLGYFMGDGSWNGSTKGDAIEITCSGRDPDVVDEVGKTMERVLGASHQHIPTRGSGQSPRGAVRVRVGANNYRKLFAAAGLISHVGGKPGNRYRRRVAVPEAIWRSPQPIAREFLSALFEADGCCRKDVIVFVSKHETFARDVQLLLLGFGIPTKLTLAHHSATRAERETRPHTAWRLAIRGLGVERFHEAVGFRGERKRSIQPRRIAGGRGRQPMPILFVDHVERVSPDDMDTVFDLEVASVHRFAANGIVVHNCHGDEDLANQEYPPTADRAFVATGRPFFRPEQMLPFGKYVRKGHLGVVTPDGEWSQQTKGWLEVFQYPKPGHTYLIGADSSMGLEEDDRGKSPSSSAAEVLDMETLEQVAEYDFRSPPHIFAAHLAGIGRFYNTALQVPEVQSSGGGGGRELLVYLRETYGYWNIHHWKHPDRVNRQDSQLLGWETTSKTRPRMLARMREVVLEQSAIIHSKRLLAQLENFGYSDAGRTEALSGHDDLLFAWGIALVSRFENYYVLPPVTSGPVEKVDWEHLGIHVTHPESPQERLRRILSTETSPNRSFMEL